MSSSEVGGQKAEITERYLAQMAEPALEPVEGAAQRLERYEAALQKIAHDMPLPDGVRVTWTQVAIEMVNVAMDALSKRSALDQRVMLACAAWEKDCGSPDLLAAYVSPVVDRNYTDVREDPEWVATLQEWEACGADEAYLPDFVLAYAEVATGAVVVG